MDKTRRDFIKNIGAAVVSAPLAASPLPHLLKVDNEQSLEIHLFSKHLQFLSWPEAAMKAKEMGFDGLDWTVRPKGHILPENVARDLPIAIQASEKAGLINRMITTAVDDVRDVLDQDVVSVAADYGIDFYRCNWFPYRADEPLEASLEFYKGEVWRLGKMNRKLNIVGCYQNHSGMKVGASVWEVREILKKVNAKYFGSQFDIRHAMAEGGRSWPNGVNLLKNQIKTIVLKDFVWGLVDGKWKIVNVPVGEGMVDFDAYFKLLKKYKINVPISLHLEYDLGGAEKGKSKIKVDKQVVYDAMKKDLITVQKLWKNA